MDFYNKKITQKSGIVFAINHIKGGKNEKLDNIIKQKLANIIRDMNKYGLKWKVGKDIGHLRKRKKYGHVPQDFSLKDYEHVILSIVNGTENDVFLYFLQGFKKDYFVFGNGVWIVIVGDDGIMETSFIVDGDYNDYLSKEKGYKYIGKVKEVLGH